MGVGPVTAGVAGTITACPKASDPDAETGTSVFSGKCAAIGTTAIVMSDKFGISGSGVIAGGDTKSSSGLRQRTAILVSEVAQARSALLPTCLH